MAYSKGGQAGSMPVSGPQAFKSQMEATNPFRKQSRSGTRRMKRGGRK